MESPVMLLLLMLFYVVSKVSSQSFGSDEQYYDDYYEEDVQIPVFMAQPKVFTVQVGESVTFPCDVRNQGHHKLMLVMTGSDAREVLLWVGREKMVRSRRLKMDYQAQHLTLSHARPNDSGIYSCKFDTLPPTEMKHKLNVQYAPTISATVPPEHRVPKGSTVRLACAAKGNPEPRIRWSRQEGPLPSGERQQEGLELILEQVDRHVEGTYLCTADNSIGEAAVAAITVIVEYPPEISTEKAVIRTGEGDRVELVCLVHGRPNPQVTWTRDGTPVDAKSTGGRYKTNYSIDNRNHSDHHISESILSHRHTLTFDKINESDFGAYMCLAENNHGSSSEVIHITGLPTLPRITSSPNGGEADTYTLKWETESFYPITEVTVRYRKNQPVHVNAVVAEAWEKVSRVIGSNEDSSPGIIQEQKLRLTGLEAARDYVTTIRVKNKYGWSPDSENFHFSTKKALAVHQNTNAGNSNIRCHFSGIHLPLIAALFLNIFYTNLFQEQLLYKYRIMSRL
ncbi:unnamed protein product [Meganyctiphanes norvegica]|uniref:Uncharacterized protein n=1 Tax=Meganyctiphanes norvegica TaxID=48144 RepID=A0AAV2PX38_MEGNR